MLVAFDFLMKLKGYGALHSLVRRWPCRSSPTTDVTRVVSAVDRAARWYLKTAWCLQRSAVTACLLRRAGHRAALVLGVSQMPFAAHAWVELEGSVVNDRVERISRYVVIDRIEGGEAKR